MAIKLKIFFKILKFKGLLILLSILVLKVNADTKVLAQKGDTLLKISERYGISLKELMYKNNFDNASKIIEGEVILIPLNKKKITYKVKEGDTLYKIARDYQVKVVDIISINNLNDSEYLKANQIILLPKEAKYTLKVNQQNVNLAKKNVFYHQISSGENLTDIAKIHNIKIEEIISLNKLEAQNEIYSKNKLQIRKNAKVKWLKYGSLRINWSDWRYFNGNYIANAKNKRNKNFFIAINCERRTLNNTLNNSNWTSWYFPINDFEFNLISDFCDNDFKL